MPSFLPGLLRECEMLLLAFSPFSLVRAGLPLYSRPALSPVPILSLCLAPLFTHTHFHQGASFLSPKTMRPVKSRKLSRNLCRRGPPFPAQPLSAERKPTPSRSVSQCCKWTLAMMSRNQDKGKKKLWSDTVTWAYNPSSGDRDVRIAQSSMPGWAR